LGNSEEAACERRDFTVINKAVFMPFIFYFKINRLYKWPVGSVIFFDGGSRPGRLPPDGGWPSVELLYSSPAAALALQPAVEPQAGGDGYPQGGRRQQ
jgi:hypothetical protein